jgi:hypothetical protein
MPKINHEQILHEEEIADEELREQDYFDFYDSDFCQEDFDEWKHPNHRPRWQRRSEYYRFLNDILEENK